MGHDVERDHASAHIMQRQDLTQDLCRVETVLQAQHGGQRRGVLSDQTGHARRIVSLDRDQHNARPRQTNRVLRQGQL